jgi:hypothetical protein
MMDEFKALNIKHSYTGHGTKILSEFLLPVLANAISYDRVTSFYTIDSLIAISQGIDSLYRHNGKMRLIIGIHSFPLEIVDASQEREFLRGQIDVIRQEVRDGLLSINDELIKRQVATIAWMIEDGLLSVKAAATRGNGLFHPKTLILKDKNGNAIAAVGSPNETSKGLGDNFEQLMVAKSWEIEDAVVDQEQFFDSLWNNTNEEAITADVTKELAATIMDTIGPRYEKPSAIIEENVHGLFATAMEMPSNFFVSGLVPSLFQHQERAVIDAVSRWPVRVLFSDEVGLGKTFEAAATITFLIRYGKVKRVVILTPKAVLKQWQEELYNNFKIDAWIFDSASRQYTSLCSKKVLQMGRSNPIGKKSPDIVLISVQYARGNAQNKSIFDSSGAVLPDLLVLDEAHSARVSKDISGKSKATKVYRMMENISKKIPHIILATATPMQKEASEYHSMLKILGLPKAWEKDRAYETSLRLIASESVPDINDAYLAGKLLRSTITMMKPSLRRLDESEQRAASEMLALGPECDQYDLAKYIQLNWNVLKKVFIKLHPAHLLTVRNTRRALEQIGYVFPKRNLIEESIENSDDIQTFYTRVNDYISDYCFSVEKVLYPERKRNIGFIKVSYQQRVASSLFSCQKSLSRRLAKLMSLKNYLVNHIGKGEDCYNAFSSYGDLDDLGEDELLYSGIEDTYNFEEVTEGVDLEELSRAVELESTSVSPLLKEIKNLLARYGDPKIQKSIDIAISHMRAEDKVLLFSRYTDTVDALIEQYKKRFAINAIRIWHIHGAKGLLGFRR